MSAQNHPQTAFHPPPYIYQLACTNLSLYGTPLSESPKLTWQREQMWKFEGKELGGARDIGMMNKKGLSAQQVTAMRKRRGERIDSWRERGGKKGGEEIDVLFFGRGDR
jgi:hypothetical protein